MFQTILDNNALKSLTTMFQTIVNEFQCKMKLVYIKPASLLLPLLPSLCSPPFAPLPLLHLRPLPHYNTIIFRVVVLKIDNPNILF